MITLAHGHIRTADADDAHSFLNLYRMDKPRAALLDKAREPVLPTRDELAMMLTKKEAFKGGLYAVDDLAGEPRGFCALRGMTHDARFAEMGILMFVDADYQSPLAADVLQFVKEEAFDRYALYKIITQALDTETAWSDFLLEHAFERCGVQRQVLFAGGAWHNLHTYCLYHPAGERVFLAASGAGATHVPAAAGR